MGTGNRKKGNGKQETGNRWHGSSKSGDFVARTEQKTISQFHDFTKQQNNKITKSQKQ
ncbi:hypothetical protein MODO_2606 [Myroides odoratimimus]|nr:hypothetical protein MODO_2606 [Myroides odoratimimus]